VLNKVDLFEMKLREKPDEFERAHPGFSGNVGNPEEAIDWVRESFMSKLKGERSPNVCVETLTCCAMEEESVKELSQKIGRKILDR
jgi:hypothetical protein